MRTEDHHPAPAGAGWVYNAELDGVRVLATREGEGEVVALHLFDDAGEPQRVEAFYPDVVRALRALPLARVVLVRDERSAAPRDHDAA